MTNTLTQREHIRLASRTLEERRLAGERLWRELLRPLPVENTATNEELPESAPPQNQGVRDG